MFAISSTEELKGILIEFANQISPFTSILI